MPSYVITHMSYNVLKTVRFFGSLCKHDDDDDDMMTGRSDPSKALGLRRETSVTLFTTSANLRSVYSVST